MNVKKNSMSKNNLFRVHGEAIVKSMPRDAIVMVNGDLMQNTVKYPQQCDGLRNDLRIVPLQLITWDWFNSIQVGSSTLDAVNQDLLNQSRSVLSSITCLAFAIYLPLAFFLISSFLTLPSQAHNYPGVVFPGSKFHPRVEGAYSFKQFLDANYKQFPIMLCGGTKEGDDTWIGKYELVTYGMCARVYRKPKSKRTSVEVARANPPVPGAPPIYPFKNVTELVQFHTGSVDGLVTLPALGGWQHL
jgi:hypothetical protein